MAILHKEEVAILHKEVAILHKEVNVKELLRELQNDKTPLFTNIH